MHSMMESLLLKKKLRVIMEGMKLFPHCNPQHDFFGSWCLDDIRTLLLQGRSNFMHTMIEAEESIMECMVFLLLCNPKARSCCNCLLIFSFLQ
jgi:hypothetical protein